MSNSIGSVPGRSEGPPFHRVPLSPPGSAEPAPRPPSRIRLDSSLRRWFTRNLGLWRSRRLYFFANEEVLRVDMMLRVESFSEPVEGESAYRFRWWPDQEFGFFDQKPQYPREGMSEAYLCGHQLRRSKCFLNDFPIHSQIRQVDEHEVVFESHYLQMDVIEHVRLIDEDRLRSRSMYSWRQGVLELAEMHHEERLEGAGPCLAASA